VTLKYGLAGLIMTMLAACDMTSVPPGKIMVKNEIRDANYNVIKVSGGGTSFTLSPGEHGIFPKGTTRLYFSRRYKEYTREYVVECPSVLKDGIKIKLIDVHLNKIAGGCETVSASKG